MNKVPQVVIDAAWWVKITCQLVWLVVSLGFLFIAARLLYFFYRL